jgi:UDP-N-acetyl-2-amino-2-deoxyglucuronate dehydrogenase
MLRRPDLDVVNICTPSGMHAEMGIAAAKAGKHVIVEKPMALSLKEADVLASSGRKALPLATVPGTTRLLSNARSGTK